LNSRSRTFTRIVALIFAYAIGAQATLQQAPPPPANQQAPASAPAKLDDSKSPQQPPSTPAAAPEHQQPPGDEKPKATKDQKTQEQQTGTSKDRLFWTLPNFLTVSNSSTVPPLTAGQKFKVVARGSFDPFELGFIGVVTAIDQAENTEPAYGQGAEGYGKRYATNFADTVVENFMVGAVFPSVLRQDPRYYQLGKGSFLHRTRYAISRIFITRSDSGRTQFNYSEIFGSAFAAAISTYAYHPPGDKTLPNTASVWGTQVAQDAISAMLKEFWPDIHRRFRKITPPQ
jgi:hypothetical protein